MPDHYTIMTTLFEDATGGLYRGIREQDGTRVVVKALRADPAARRDVDRLHHEYDILRQLSGPWVLDPIELDNRHDQPVLVFTGFAGVPLSERTDGPMPTARFLDIAIRLAEALVDLHRQGVVHRDLKPANILFRPETGELKLHGFGIAAWLAQLAAVPTSANLIEGSPAYMSPEQTGYASRGTDHRSDLYSLGVILYELLTGQLPFEATDPVELVHSHVARPPRPPQEVTPAVPAVLAELVLRLLAKQPEERYQSARGLLSDLEHCRDVWTDTGAIPPFPLGRSDVSDRFQISAALYGRDRETAILIASFERVRSTGRSGLTLVSGYSGIGKSSLVRQLRGPVVAARGYFLGGKYDQARRDIPYAPLVMAFRDLLKQILTESDDRVRAWADALRQALGRNARVLVDLVPQLALIIGTPPPVPAISPSEAESRLDLTFQRFVGVFARREHPLVLFLDDLQWLDPSSLRLVVRLLATPERQALLVVGAYRSNEVGPAHPLVAAIDRVRRHGLAVEEVLLGPLAPAELTRLIGDSLRRPLADSMALAQLVHDKTAGNPFFAVHFLTLLYEEGLVGYDAGSGGWGWDLAAIHRHRFTDNVVELMLVKLRRTPPAAQQALMIAACIGHAVDARILALLCDLPEDELDRTLREATDEGLVWRAEGTYTFLHDRVQEAAYALLPPDQRADRHLRIGRTLLARTDPDRLAEHIFDIVGQLNIGRALITSAAELSRLAELNLLAGRQAKAATAFASAVTYLAAGVALLDPTTEPPDPGLSYTLRVELAECEYLAGDFEHSARLLAVAERHARSLPERAWVYRLRQRLLQLSGRFHEAMAVSLDALRLFGVSLPATDYDTLPAAEDEIRLVPEGLRGRRVAELADVPITDDAEVRAMIGLLAEAMPLVYAVRPKLWPLVTVKGVNACLRRGHAEEAPFVYSCYAMVLVGVARDIAAAQEFSELALALNERFPSAAAWRGKLLFHHAALVNVWSHHFATGLPLLEQAFQACLDAGDIVHAGYLTYNAIWLHLENGDPLPEVVELARRYAGFAREAGNDVVGHVVGLEERFALALRGTTRSATDLGGPEFDEAQAVAAIEQAGFGLGIAYHRIMKLILAYHAGLFEEALECADRAAPMLLNVASMANEATYYLYRALTLTALWDQAPSQRQRELGQLLREPVERLQFWADHCPENFAHRYALVSAELARIHGRELAAMRGYDQAQRYATENGFVHGEALAAELAGRFYHSRGFDRIAATYLRQARAGYARWGADGKVRQLDLAHPRLIEPATRAPTTLFSAPVEQLDLVSVVKGSQAISEELALPRLQETLMRLALEHAGAQRGYLLLADGDRLTVHARADIEDEQTRVEVLPALPDSAVVLPMTLLNYVRRSGESVVLADATMDGRYAADEYVMRHKPRSVLALPITRQGRPMGILYLENNLIAGAFIPTRLTVLEMLAAQVAISLETARLYADLQQENAERRRAEDEVRQLNRELEQRVLDRTAQLAATNKELEAYAYSVSHDLRAPLRHIHGFLELLRRRSSGVLDVESLRYVDVVTKAATRMETLIDDLLDFSRTGRQELSHDAVDLDQLVGDILREVEPDTQGRAVRWRVAGLPAVVGDSALLRIALVNLIRNALKFSRPRDPAEIEIGSTTRDGDPVVYVRDNGVGFDQRQAGQLFGVFQRLHLEKDFEGTGIGLATVRRVIERHGGQTWADGAVGQGATFYFSLPRS